MFKPTWIITIVIVIAVILGGLYFLPIHTVTVTVTQGGLPLYNAVIHVGDTYARTDADGKVTFSDLQIDTYTIYLDWGDYVEPTITQVTVGIFDINKSVNIDV